MVTNCSVRTEAWVSPWARSLLICSASCGASGRRWLLTHSSRSAPSSGTVRTMKQDLVDLLGAAGDVEQPGQRLAVAVALVGVLHADAGVDDRGGDRPGLGGVVLDDRDPLQLGAVRRSVVDLDALQDARAGPGCRGPRLGPWVALARNEVQPSSPPTAYSVEANIQPVAERPRTGTTVIQQNSQTQTANSNAESHACWLIAQNAGRLASARNISWPPERPKNQPIRSRW